MGLHVADRVGVHVRQEQRLRDRGGLPVHPGGGEAHPGRAVVGHRRAEHHGIDAVAVLDRVGEALQRHHTAAVAVHRARRRGVEGAAMAVRREDAAFLIEVASDERCADRDPAGEREVALPGEQRLAGEVDRQERGRAGRLRDDARPHQAELVRGAAGQEVAVVAEQEPEHPGRLHQLAVRQQVDDQIDVGAAAGIDADPQRRALRIAAGVLQRLPGALQEDAVLRVHQLRLARGEAEEGGVEPVAVRDHPLGPHEARIGEQARIDSGRGELLHGGVGDRLDAVAQVAPQLAHRAGAGKARGEADDGDARRGVGRVVQGFRIVRTHGRLLQRVGFQGLVPRRGPRARCSRASEARRSVVRSRASSAAADSVAGGGASTVSSRARLSMVG